MAKLSVAVLFLFFTFSLARTPSTLPVNDVTHLKLPSENDVTLPELPKTVPVNDVIIHELPKTLPESDESLPADMLPSMPYREETRSVHSVPLKLVRFRPINRRFRLRSSLPFRLCHHHLKPGSRRQIPFGNDMILSSQRNIDFDKFVYRIGLRQIPSDPFSFNHNQYSDKKIWKFLDDRENFGEMKLKDQSPHHHHNEDDNEDNSHEQRKMSKFLDDREKFWGMKLNDQSPHHHHHHHEHDNEDNDHQQRKISKFQITHENRGNFDEIKSKNENQFRSHHIDDEADKRSKLYAEYPEMKLRKRFHYNAGEEDEEKAKEETKWHKKEKKKGGFMRGIRKFLHHYFD